MSLINYLHKKRRVRSVEIEEVSRSLDDQDEAVMLKKPISETGLVFLRYAVLFVFLLILSRVFYLQIVKGSYYSEMAQDNRIRFTSLKAPRGIIFDRSGKRLVQNVSSFDAIVIPADLSRDIKEREEDEKELAEIFNMNDQNVRTIVESQDMEMLEPVLIKENISQEEALVFAEKKVGLEGFYLDQTAIRQYEDGTYFSSIMGYSGKIGKEELDKQKDYLMTDSIGKTGLEYSYEKYLRGQHGRQEVEVDSAGNIKKNFGVKNPVNGSDLYLSIDADLQKKIVDSLSNVLSETDTKTAAAVAIDPQNGEVLALVNLPSYDNNLFAKGISQEDYKSLISDENKPMFNRAVSGEYPPGSTFKPIVAAAALEEKAISSETSVNCSGGIHIGSYSFPDWKTHGVTDVRKAIAESCDVFFYSIGGGWGDIPGLGIDRIKKYANLFGLGKISGIDIPGEAKGLVPDQSWKQERIGEKWYIGDDYHCSIGQGFDTATPLQLANLTAALSNGGVVYQPHIVRKIQNSSGSEEKIEPKIMDKNFISSSNMEVVKQGMRQTIVSGSARSLNDLSVPVAGKTGTAQFGSEGKTHGWFISFAPYDNPQIAMAILVEGGGEGSSTAVPVTKEIYKWYFEERSKK